MPRGVQLQVGCGEGRSLVLLMVGFHRDLGKKWDFFYLVLRFPAQIQLPGVAAGKFLVSALKSSWWQGADPAQLPRSDSI